jgi:3-hydroxy-9,10-secoandrosta-1,3,5(10)-triene-9,17-dione monooxygenase reductase component
MGSSDLRDVFAAVPGGVVVVAAAVDGGFRGLTASTFIPLSLEPPQVLISLDLLAATTEAVRASKRFSVSLLERRQEFLAERFAGRAPQVVPDWREAPHRLSPGGLPFVDGAVAWFECGLAGFHEAGDHGVAIGAVTHAERGGGEPLLHWDRSYWRLA